VQQLLTSSSKALSNSTVQPWGLVLPASPFLSDPGGITAASVLEGKLLLLTSWSLLSDIVHHHHLIFDEKY
jgi:hypothetical protein